MRGRAGRALLLSSLLPLRANPFVAAARSLVGVLAAAILLCELLAANSGFHQALHRSGKAASDSCVLCLFAKGQVDLPQSVLTVPESVRSSFDLTPRMESVALPDFTYLVSPSRAPPAFASLL